MHVVGITERIDKHEKEKNIYWNWRYHHCYRRYRNRGILLATGNVEDSVANIDLCGTWKVLNHAGTPVDNEYLVFDDTTVNDYRDGNTTPYIQSAYTVKGSELNLTDASKNSLSELCLLTI